MNPKVKLSLYLAFALGAGVFGFVAFGHYKKAVAAEAEAAATAPPLDSPNLNRGVSSSSSYGYSRVISFGAGFIIMIVGLGLLIGHDVSQYIGNRAIKVLFNDEGEAMTTPEYEIAEQEWANGNHLEAIRLMRDYLQKNPREQHVSIRIAEIYEKDLQNNLAAALEYEEVLKHKLPAERWGWAAIHLCNLYFKLDQSQKAVALLKRIDAEYGETAAAGKARKRLSEIEPGSFVDAAVEETDGEAPSVPATAEPKLPPGFTLKKS